jgi:hypothetical protein
METKSYLLEHSYGDWTPKEPATCTETGIDARYCTMCDKEETTVAAVLGHDEVVTPGTPATCTTPGVKDLIQCARCNLVLQEATVIESGHQIVEQKYMAPTCGLPGQTEGSYCARCLTVFEKSEVIPAVAHTPVTVPGREATCNIFGLTDYQVCSTCDAVLVMPEVISRLGHTLKDGACIRCGHNCDHGVDPEGLQWSGSMEKYVDDYENKVCTEYPYNIYQCKTCGQESWLVNVAMAYLHSTGGKMTVPRIVIDATPDRTGLSEKHCKYCGLTEQYVRFSPAEGMDERFDRSTLGRMYFKYSENDDFVIRDYRPGGSSAVRIEVLGEAKLKLMWLDAGGYQQEVVLEPSPYEDYPMVICEILPDGDVQIRYAGLFG